MPRLIVQRLHPSAAMPSYGSRGAIGLDLTTTHEVVIPPMARRRVRTGLAFAIPPTHYGRIAPRSGLAAEKGIDVLAGVIDSDFRGEVRIILINFGETEVHFNPGDRVAQLILERADRVDVELDLTLSATERGAAGFGSTGL